MHPAARAAALIPAPGRERAPLLKVECVHFEANAPFAESRRTALRDVAGRTRNERR